MFRLDGKVAIVTGAGGGFGEGIAKAYVERGAKVVVADIRLDAAQQVVQGLGESTRAFQVDVSNGAQIQALVDFTKDTFGSVDIVVNNAAITHKNQPMLGVEEDEFDRMFAVNVKSIYLMAKSVVPVMREQKSGVILNIGSVAGIRPRPGLTWYNGSKGAVNILSKSMAVELGPDNIRVNAICPVMGMTGMFELFTGLPNTPENNAKFVGTIPLGRFSEPKDIAAAAVFLASDEAGFFTGLELPVDGGRTI